MKFRVGQKVVCIGHEGTPKPAGWWESWEKEWGIIKPQRGPVYTVRDTRIAANGTQRIRLVEIVNPVIEYVDAAPQEPWFFSDAFRPAVERKTDISIFTAMLTGPKQGVSA